MFSDSLPSMFVNLLLDTMVDRIEFKFYPQNTAAKVRLPGDEGQSLLLDARQSPGRILSAEHDAVHSWQQARFRPMGVFRQSWLGLRGHSAVLPQVAGPTESVLGQEHETARNRLVKCML